MQCSGKIPFWGSISRIQGFSFRLLALFSFQYGEYLLGTFPQCTTKASKGNNLRSQSISFFKKITGKQQHRFNYLPGRTGMGLHYKQKSKMGNVQNQTGDTSNWHSFTRNTVYLSKTTCDPLVADLFLFCYERDFMTSLTDVKQAETIEEFKSTSRYLNDVLHIDNPYFDGQSYLSTWTAVIQS